MTFSRKKKHSITNFGLTQLILILIVIFLIIVSIGVNHPINYIKANRDERISNSIRTETLDDLNSDREERSENRFVTSNAMQNVARKEAIKEYRIISQKPAISKYSFHELSTNSAHPKTKIGRKLSQHSDVRYGENCAEISFGKRTFHNARHQFQPFRSARMPWQVANLVNNHYINYDQASENIHRKNIINRHNETVGVSVIYNRKLNRGILVEEFARRSKMYRYSKIRS